MIMVVVMATTVRQVKRNNKTAKNISNNHKVVNTGKTRISFSRAFRFKVILANTDQLFIYLQTAVPNLIFENNNIQRAFFFKYRSWTALQVSLVRLRSSSVLNTFSNSTLPRY